MVKIYEFPFDSDLGYPQKQQVKIDTTAYTLYFRWNPEDGGFAVLKIKRNIDSVTVFSSCLARYSPVEIRDPSTYILLFTIFPYVVSDTQCTIWVVTNE